MNTVDLLNAIGEVDDILIKKAKMHQKNHTTFFAVLGSAAACLVLCFMLPIVFIAMRGANSAAPESPNNSESLGCPDYEIVRIEVMSSTKRWTIADYTSLKEIHTAISTLTADHGSDSNESSPSDAEFCEESQTIQSEAVINSDSNPRVESATEYPTASTKQLVIELTHCEGEVLRYKLAGTILTSLDTGEEYPLTQEDARMLRSLLE